MDDHKLIADDNPVVNGTMGPLSIWFRMDFPLSTFVFWIQWLLFGEHAAGYHVVNIVLHALSSFLVWRLLVRLRVLGAWLAAAIFGLHPVCVASVGRIAELKNTLSLPFFLLSFLAYLRYEAICATSRKGPEVASRNMWPRAFWYALSLCSFVLALLSKTSVLMLPVVLLACAWWQRGRISRLDLVQTSPFLVLSLAFGLMTAWFQKYQALTGLTVEHHTFLERLILAERVFWFYLEKAFIPTNLNVVYPKWRIDGTSIISHAPALALVGLAIICWHFRNTKARHALFGIVCFAVTLFPALGFFDSQFLTMWQVSDHLQYLPLIAAAALIGAGLTSGLGHRARAASALALLAMLLLLSFNRAQLFTNEERMWRDTLAKNPAAWAAHNDLGCILARRNEHSEAIDHFTASLQHNPGNADAHSNLGQALALRGKLDEAEAHFRAALRLKPSSAEAHKRFGAVLGMRGRHRESAIHLRAALALKPEFQTRMDMAAALYKAGDARGAATQLRQVVSAKPDLPDALSNLAWLLATSPDASVRDGAEAVRWAERACQLTEFKISRMIGILAAAYAEAGRFQEAVGTADQALQVELLKGETPFAASIRYLRACYEEGKPWHETSVQ